MGGVVAHKIIVSAPVPLELILTGFDCVGAGPWGFGFWVLGRGLTKEKKCIVILVTIEFAVLKNQNQS